MSAAAPALPPGWRLCAYDTVGSTNDIAKRLARDGAAAPTLVWARAQTNGRGRRGRVWASPPGNLYCSAILRPRYPPAAAAQLGFVAAVAVGEALLPLLPPAAMLAYKWPNDVLLDGRKLAGILLEAETGTSAAVDFIIIGVGVNLASSPPESEYPATALAEVGRYAPDMILAAYVRALHTWYERWRQEGFAPVRAAWRARAAGLGRPIRVRLDAAALHGRFLDIDQDGALLLEAAGQTRRVAAGEVFPANG